MDLFYSLKSPYRKNAVWILNDSTIKAIRKLKDNNGQYLWQPSLVAGTPDTIAMAKSTAATAVIAPHTAHRVQWRTRHLARRKHRPGHRPMQAAGHPPAA